MNTGGEIRCLHCDEPVTEVAPERVNVISKNGLLAVRLVHKECRLRQVVGGVNHLKGTCTCCGGKDDPDPPGLSRHMAAYMASDYWHGRGTLSRAGPDNAKGSAAFLRFIFGGRK